MSINTLDQAENLLLHAVNVMVDNNQFELLDKFLHGLRWQNISFQLVSDLYLIILFSGESLPRKATILEKVFERILEGKQL